MIKTGAMVVSGWERELFGNGHHWGVVNVLCLDLGDGYLNVYIYQNISGSQLHQKE